MAEYAIGAGEMVNRLLTLVVGEIGLVVGVKDDVKKLGTVLMGIRALLRDAEKKQGEHEVVRHWLHQLKEVAYDAEDVLDDVDYKELKYTLNNDDDDNNKKKVTRWLNPKLLIARGKIAHKIKAINKRLDDIYKNATMQLQLVPLLESNPQIYGDVDRETASHVKDSTVIGRENDKEKIIKMLINDGSTNNDALSVIPIVGFGGLGKTTLARLVYNDHDVKEYFDLRAWTFVSADFRTSNLYVQILNEINENNTETESSSKSALHKELQKHLDGKKVLLVLDDDWNEDETKWENFVQPLEDFVSAGSKVIVTSRDRNVASAVRGAQALYLLKGLSDEDCWGLIESQAFKRGGPFKTSDHELLVEIGKKISNKCHGLPLAAKVLGGLLKSKRGEREWSDVLNDKIWSLNKKDPIKNVLKLSYDNLSPALQACFSYCAILPKDGWISTGLLVQLWMAQGLLEAPRQELLKASSSQCQPTLEDAGMICFDTLYSKSFFQEAEMNTYGEVTRCKMHHHLHDLAQSIRGPECQVFGESIRGPERQVLGESSVRSTDLSECRHVSMISLTTIEVLQHEAKKVRTIFGWESTSKELDDGGTLFQFESLRVLDLSGFRGFDFSSFSCKYFKHLRYLDLSYTSINSLPMWVAQLYHLQTLKLIKCGNLTKLPEDLIKLKKLRHLFIDDHKKWKKMPQALGKLHQLQTLPLFVACQEDGGCGISVLKNLNDLRGELDIYRLSLVKKANLAKEGILSKKSSLRELRLDWDGNSSVGDELLVLEVLRPHTNLQGLSIEGFGGVKFPAWVSNGSDLPNLVRLELSNCNHCEHIPSFGGLHRLKEMELRSMANLKEWLEGGGVMFPCLEKLLIKDCPDLNKTPEHVFPSLKSLDLENVGGMGVVSITSSLTSLTSLTITKCKDLEYLQEGLVSNNSQLNVVLISNCPILKAFEEEASAADEILPNRFLCELVIDESGISFAREGILRISKCPELESIGKGFLSSLVFLERFQVGGCSKLKHIELSQSFNHPRHLVIYGCPYFEGFDISTTTEQQQQQLVLPCCHTLKISYCPAISSIDFQSFASLHELWIANCPGLQALQGLPFLTALQKLTIHECPAISSIDLPTLSSFHQLRITSCRGLQALQGLPFLTALQKLTIHLSYWPSAISEGDDAVEIHQLQHLTMLKYLEVDSFNCLTVVPEWLGNFASLEKLSFENCKNLRQLPSKEQMLRLTSLKELKIYECHAISSIDLPTLPSLHKLYIYDCPEISSIDLSTLRSLRQLHVRICKGLQALQGFQFLTALQELLLGPFSEELNDFPLTISANDDDASSLQFNNPLILPCLCKLWIQGWDALQSLPHHLQRFTTLKALHIWNFSKLTGLPEWLGNLTSLEELSIVDCENLSHLPSKEQMQRLTLLQKLDIYRCPGLKESCSRKGEEWPKISHIPQIFINGWTQTYNRG